MKSEEKQKEMAKARNEKVEKTPPKPSPKHPTKLRK